jgi:hypothetical protein
MINLNARETPKRQGRLKRLCFNIGTLALDATKLCFGSLVLGAAIRGEIPTGTLMLIGIIASIIGGVVGLSMITIFEEK